ncbi:hypothetical protein D3C87_1558560 [compost metagenome]
MHGPEHRARNDQPVAAVEARKPPAIEEIDPHQRHRHTSINDGVRSRAKHEIADQRHEEDIEPGEKPAIGRRRRRQPRLLQARPHEEGKAQHAHQLPLPARQFHLAPPPFPQRQRQHQQPADNVADPGETQRPYCSHGRFLRDEGKAPEHRAQNQKQSGNPTWHFFVTRFYLDQNEGNAR